MLDDNRSGRDKGLAVKRAAKSSVAPGPTKPRKRLHAEQVRVGLDPVGEPFTAERVAKSTHRKRHTITLNSWLSDASQRNWPEKSRPGALDELRIVVPEQDPPDEMWRNSLGTSLATALGLTNRKSLK